MTRVAAAILAAGSPSARAGEADELPSLSTSQGYIEDVMRVSPLNVAERSRSTSPSHTSLTAFDAMRKALADAIARKDAGALFGLVEPTFVWTVESESTDQFDMGRDALHNFKVAFGFHEFGKTWASCGRTRTPTSSADRLPRASSATRPCSRRRSAWRSRAIPRLVAERPECSLVPPLR